MDADWREFNIHGSGDDDAQPADIFASTEPDYSLFHYENRDGKLIELETEADDGCSSTKRVTLRAEESYDRSTGISIWRGSEILCSFLLSNPEVVRSKRVLEIGAGVGLCGIVCATWTKPASIIITDGDLKVLNNLRYNVAQNGLETVVSCPQLIWSKENAEAFESKHGKQDVILASDCLYIAQSIKPLWELVNHVLVRDGLFLYVDSTGQCDFERVVRTALEFDFHYCSEEDWTEESQEFPVRIFRRKGFVSAKKAD